MKIAKLIILFVILSLTAGCDASFSSASASAVTPTVVVLAAVTPTLPTPTLTPLPPPSPTPFSSTPTSAPPLPVVEVASPTPAITPTQPAALPAAVVTTAASDPASLNGGWDFAFGTMSLSEQNMSLKGSYQWYGGVDTGQLNGVTLPELRQFQGLWFSDRSPNSQGFWRGQLTVDGTGFSGTFEGNGHSRPWCGARSGQSLPPGCGFSGLWQLRFGSPPGLGQATLTQTGAAVTGTFVDSEGQPGEIGGGVVTVHSLTEASLSGFWRNGQGEQDSFEWRLNLTTGRTFAGRHDPGNSEWCGWRQGSSEPDECGF